MQAERSNFPQSLCKLRGLILEEENTSVVSYIHGQLVKFKRPHLSFLEVESRLAWTSLAILESMGKGSHQDLPPPYSRSQTRPLILVTSLEGSYGSFHAM